MGVSLITAIILKNSKVEVSIQGPDKKGLFSGVIGHMENGHYRLDITTDFCFKSKTAAWKGTRAIVKEIKGLKVP